jgi:hypothetical protein
MGKRRYAITVTTRAEVEIDDAVFAAVDDDWRKHFHGYVRTADDVAEFVGGVMLRHNYFEANMIDGFANLPDGVVKIGKLEWEAEAEPLDE